MEPTKERIEKEAEAYVFNHIHDAFGLSRQECYIAGYERAQQELQAYRDIIKLADLALSTIKLEPTMSGSVFGNFDRRLFISRRADFYDSYQKLLPLIDTVTPT